MAANWLPSQDDFYLRLIILERIRVALHFILVLGIALFIQWGINSYKTGRIWTVSRADGILLLRTNNERELLDESVPYMIYFAGSRPMAGGFVQAQINLSHTSPDPVGRALGRGSTRR
jgi:hypothetical protein